MDVLAQFKKYMLDADIGIVDMPLADGHIHRFHIIGDKPGTRNGWYVLHDGSIPAGAFGNWKTGEKQKWCGRDINTLSVQDRTNWKNRIRKSLAAREKEIEKIHLTAQKTALLIWNKSCLNVSEHDYLKAKGIKACGARRYRDVVIIPLYDSSRCIKSLQFISKSGTKKFLNNGPVAGHYYPIGNIKERLYICEGFATGATIHEATGEAVAVAFNATNITPVAASLRSKYPDIHIIICADNDQWTDGNPGLVNAQKAASAVNGIVVAPVFVNLEEGPTDFNDLANIESINSVKLQLCQYTAAPAEPIPDNKKSGEVYTLSGDASHGSNILDSPVPWPETVDGDTLFNEVSETFDRYVSLPKGASAMLALWAGHCHALNAFQHTPRLNITSPEPECGKTLLLDVMELLTPKSLRTENITLATLFRLVDDESPTLLIDEYDTFLKKSDELIGALNAGHKRGGNCLRCVGDAHVVKSFKTFAPVALAGIRAIKGPLATRSIVIQLKRARKDEVKSRFDSRYTSRERELNQKLARWAIDNMPSLSDCDPELPEGVFNRNADKWRPLFAVATIVGGDWPKRIHTSFLQLSAPEDKEDEISTMLLTDIRSIFQANNSGRLPSALISNELGAMDERPWSEWGRQGKPITQKAVASLLRPFRITPKTFRCGQDTIRGYMLEDFKDTFDRYLTSATATPKQASINNRLDDNASETPSPDVADKMVASH